MHRAVSQLRAFRTAMNQPVGDEAAPDPTRDVPLCIRLIAEEFEELLEAIEPTLKPGIVRDVEAWLMALDVLRDKHEGMGSDTVAIADALADLSYVTISAAVRWGIPFGHVFDEVHRSNLEKANGPIREDGKRLKPEGWKPPDVEGVLTRSRLGVYALLATRAKLIIERARAASHYDEKAVGDLREQIDALDVRLSDLGFTSSGAPLHVKVKTSP